MSSRHVSPCLPHLLVVVLSAVLTWWWVLPLIGSFGADLTLHTRTLLPALSVSSVANPLVAQNLLICLHLFLNFVCTYALAFRETRHVGAALVAALIFGWSPYVSARLAGHFNFVAAWVIPLAALFTIRALERRTLSSGALLGVVLGAIACVDYYALRSDGAALSGGSRAVRPIGGPTHRVPRARRGVRQCGRERASRGDDRMGASTWSS